MSSLHTRLRADAVSAAAFSRRAPARTALLLDLAETLHRELLGTVLTEDPATLPAEGIGAGVMTVDRLLRLLALLLPRELWPLGSTRFAQGRARMLRARAEADGGSPDVFALYDAAAFHVAPTPAQTARHAAVRAYYVDVAAEAVVLAERWGRRSHWRERAAALAGRTAPVMPDGLLFPVLAGLSACARRVPMTAALAPGTGEPAGDAAGDAPTTATRWTVRPPEGFDEPAFMDETLALVREEPWRGDVDAFGRDGGAYLATPTLCCEQLVRLGWVPVSAVSSDDGSRPASPRGSLSKRWQPPAAARQS